MSSTGGWAAGSWSEVGMAAMGDRLHQVEAGFAAMMADFPTAMDAIVRLDREVGDLQRDRQDSRSRGEGLEERVRDLAGLVNRLATQVAWLEQQVRAGSGAQPVDLDGADPELTGLADTVEAGREAAEELLDTYARAALEATVSEVEELREAHRAALATLMVTSLELADTDLEDLAAGTSAASGERPARAEYRTARGIVVQAGRRLAELTVEAERAREGLAADADRRERLRPTLEAGERAEMELMTRLRTRVASALAEGALLPVWLSSALGPLPPAGSGQRWTETAARLIAYRVTHRVTGPDTFGELPAEAPARRRRQYEDLQAAVTALHR